MSIIQALNDPSITFTLSDLQPSLCLNMIVKNESRIITRLLQSVVHVIDSYCICDTGSTDNTVEIITDFFNKANIPGKIIYEPFKDFGYNRTFALNACVTMENADYMLLLDADMIFQLNPNVSPNDFKKMLKDDAYTIFQGSESFYYRNTRIVKNRKRISYWGVTHEYVCLPNGCVQGGLEKAVVFINDIGDGGAKSNKVARDIELLKNGLKELPNNDRYTFYLANTYHDAGQYDLAIDMYRKRIEIGGWYEEVWYSYYRIGKCFAKLGNMKDAIESWLEAYNVFPNRVENLCEVIKYYRETGKTNLAYAYYILADKARTMYPNFDYLFTEKDAYEYKLDFELSIIAYYTNTEKYDIPKYCIKVMNHPNIEEIAVRNVFSNYKFYARALMDYAINTLDTSVLQTMGNSLSNELEDFYPTTPTLCLGGPENNILTVLKRYVNYRIDEHGGYVNKEQIVTKNVVSTFLLNEASHKLEKRENDPEFLLGYDNTLDNVYVGLEDVRLCEHDGTIYYNSNRGLGYNLIRVEHGILSKTAKSTEQSTILMKHGSSEIEKNWVIAHKKNGTIYCIYKWFPLTVGALVKEDPDDEINSVFSTIHEHATPRLFRNLRGSTNGVMIGDEIWFLCHSVSYEDRRYYYQLFVVLDSSTYKVKKYTPLFTFEHKKVEYSLGFVYLKHLDALFIGYSLMDSETKYMTLPLAAVENMFIFV